MERLLPKIFDDVQMKGWHGNLHDADEDRDRKIIGNIDTKMALKFIKASLENSSDASLEPLSVNFLFAIQKQRVEKQTIKIMERFNSKIADLRERLKNPIPETDLANEIYAIKNAAILDLQSLFKYTTVLEPNEELEGNIRIIEENVQTLMGNLA